MRSAHGDGEVEFWATIEINGAEICSEVCNAGLKLHVQDPFGELEEYLSESGILDTLKVKANHDEIEHIFKFNALVSFLMECGYELWCSKNTNFYDYELSLNENATPAITTKEKAEEWANYYFFDCPGKWKSTSFLFIPWM